MNVKELRRAHQTRPFRRFRLHLVDGRAVSVTHPDNFMVSSDGRFIAAYVPGKGTEFLEPAFLTAIEFGKRRRSR